MSKKKWFLRAAIASKSKSSRASAIAVISAPRKKSSASFSGEISTGVSQSSSAVDLTAVVSVNESPSPSHLETNSSDRKPPLASRKLSCIPSIFPQVFTTLGSPSATVEDQTSGAETQGGEGRPDGASTVPIHPQTLPPLTRKWTSLL